MSLSLKSNVLQCRICWKVAMAAFIAILVVELIVLIPSYRKFALDWKNSKSLQVLSAIQATSYLRRGVENDGVQFTELLRSISKLEAIKGLRILAKDNQRIIAENGDMSDAIVSFEKQSYLSGFLAQSYFDVIWTPDVLRLPYHLHIRLDSSKLQPALNGFVVRIAGLVGIISLFVTIAIMLSLRKTILSPVLRLRNQLNAASDDLQRADEYVIKTKGHDEIAEVNRGFNSLLRHTVGSFREIQQGNTALHAEIEERRQIEIQLRQSEKVLEKLANFDELTGLPNRHFALEKLELAIKSATENSTIGALLLVDLDNFKDINDTLGHSKGDELLRQAANRMKNAIRFMDKSNKGIVSRQIDASANRLDDRPGSDVVARTDGDEFMVILPEISDDHARAIAERIQQACTEPFLLQDSEVFVTASIGVSIFPRDSEKPNACMSCSDTALYVAKKAGRNCYYFFSQEMNANTAQRIKIDQQLRYALDRNEFEMFYQPVIDLESGSTIAVEALIRWNNGELGSVPPDQFIPVAESTGLIVPIGEWVMATAFQRCEELAKLGFPLRMAINVSPKQFRSNRFVSQIKNMLEQYRIRPEQIELEITEGILIDDQSDAIHGIAELSAIGVRFSIDDFGTGYSALSYLRRFSVNTLKIDRSFISEICDEKKDAPLVRTIISMAKNFELEIIAEGVETVTQLEFLLVHGCDQAQGYYFSKPKPFTDLVEHLEQQ